MGLPCGHPPVAWARLTEAEERELGGPHWGRRGDCDCNPGAPYQQVTSHDPSDPNHPDHWDDIAGYAQLGKGEASE